MEHSNKHLDSRRHEYSDGEEKLYLYRDYLIELNDKEAVKASPFNKDLEGLSDFGFDEIVIYNPDLLGYKTFEDDTSELRIMATKNFPNTEKMVDEYLGGDIRFSASIETDGERSLSVSFGAGDQKDFPPGDLHETIWTYLESIHKSLSSRTTEDSSIAAIPSHIKSSL